MSWRVHTARVNQVEFLVCSKKQVNYLLGGYEHEKEEQNERVLLVTDPGNQEAWVIEGDPTARELMLRRLKRALNKKR